MIRQAVIVCGGLGTRLGSLVRDLPKPMLPVGGMPILEHDIRLLARHGITDIILAARYRSEAIERHFGDGSAWGVRISVSVEPVPLGTAGALGLVADRLDDAFLTLYGDVFLDFDLPGLLGAFEAERPLATLLARPSTHPWDAHLIQTDGRSRVTEFVVEHEPGRLYRNLGNAAVYVLSKRVLDSLTPGVKAGFMEDVFPKALEAGEVLMTHAMGPAEYVKDMGIPERFAEVEAYLELRAEVAKARAERGPVNAVILDRDGVINEEVDLLHRPDQLRILEGVPEAIRILNEAGIKVLVATNQPAVARGLCDEATLEAIHRELRARLAREGAVIDAIYHCPHHPETHHGQGVRELRRACSCRKPGIGLIVRAKREHGLDLGRCVMVGDSTIDIEAGYNAGLLTALVQTGSGRVRPGGRSPDRTYPTLLDAARDIRRGAFDPAAATPRRGDH